MKKLFLCLIPVLVFMAAPAQAMPLPLNFLRAMEESVKGAELLTQVRAYAGESLELAEIARTLERGTEWRMFREELMGKAYDYFNAFNPRAGSHWDAREVTRRIKIFYSGLAGRDWDSLVRMMNSPMRDLGLYPLAEFLPVRGTRDFVGLRMLTAPLAN